MSHAVARRRFLLDEGMVAVLAEELDYLAIAIGDEIEHAANKRDGKSALDVLERQSRRLPLALALARAVETAELDVIGMLRLDDIAELVKVSEDEMTREVAHLRDELRTYIIGGDPALGFRDPRLKEMSAEEARRASIDEYHEQIARCARRGAEARRFLAAVGEWQEDSRRALGI